MWLFLLTSFLFPSAIFFLFPIFLLIIGGIDTKSTIIYIMVIMKIYGGGTVPSECQAHSKEKVVSLYQKCPQHEFSKISLGDISVPAIYKTKRKPVRNKACNESIVFL